MIGWPDVVQWCYVRRLEFRLVPFSADTVRVFVSERNGKQSFVGLFDVADLEPGYVMICLEQTLGASRTAPARVDPSVQRGILSAENNSFE